MYDLSLHPEPFLPNRSVFYNKQTKRIHFGTVIPEDYKNQGGDDPWKPGMLKDPLGEIGPLTFDLKKSLGRPFGPGSDERGFTGFQDVLQWPTPETTDAVLKALRDGIAGVKFSVDPEQVNGVNLIVEGNGNETSVVAGQIAYNMMTNPLGWLQSEKDGLKSQGIL